MMDDTANSADFTDLISSTPIIEDDDNANTKKKRMKSKMDNFKSFKHNRKSDSFLSESQCRDNKMSNNSKGVNTGGVENIPKQPSTSRTDITKRRKRMAVPKLGRPLKSRNQHQMHKSLESKQKSLHWLRTMKLNVSEDIVSESIAKQLKSRDSSCGLEQKLKGDNDAGPSTRVSKFFKSNATTPRITNQTNKCSETSDVEGLTDSSENSEIPMGTSKKTEKSDVCEDIVSEPIAKRLKSRNSSRVLQQKLKNDNDAGPSNRVSKYFQSNAKTIKISSQTDKCSEKSDAEVVTGSSENSKIQMGTSKKTEKSDVCEAIVSEPIAKQLKSRNSSRLLQQKLKNDNDAGPSNRVSKNFQSNAKTIKISSQTDKCSEKSDAEVLTGSSENNKIEIDTSKTTEKLKVSEDTVNKSKLHDSKHRKIKWLKTEKLDVTADIVSEPINKQSKSRNSSRGLEQKLKDDSDAGPSTNQQINAKIIWSSSQIKKCSETNDAEVLTDSSKNSEIQMDTSKKSEKLDVCEYIVSKPIEEQKFKSKDSSRAVKSIRTTVPKHYQNNMQKSNTGTIVISSQSEIQLDMEETDAPCKDPSSTGQQTTGEIETSANQTNESNIRRRSKRIAKMIKSYRKENSTETKASSTSQLKKKRIGKKLTHERLEKSSYRDLRANIAYIRNLSRRQTSSFGRTIKSKWISSYDNLDDYKLVARLSEEKPTGQIRQNQKTVQRRPRLKNKTTTTSDFGRGSQDEQSEISTNVQTDPRENYAQILTIFDDNRLTTINEELKLTNYTTKSVFVKCHCVSATIRVEDIESKESQTHELISDKTIIIPANSTYWINNNSESTSLKIHFDKHASN